MKGGNQQPAIDGSEHIGPDSTGDNVDAKKVAGYRWNPSIQPNGGWERDTGDDPNYATRIDDSETGAIYVGKAPTGAEDNAAVWQIAKLDISSGLIKTWADGDASFNNTWDNRLTLTYI